MAEKRMMKGNEAIVEAAIRAGARFFSGYPITPQTEILEYFSSNMEKAGGVFVQTESEISGISMVYGAAATGARAITSSSGPGFSLMQEGISYLVSAELPCVIVDVMRYGNGLGDIFQAQGDYWQVVKNGGHGDYRCLVYAPSSVQEAANLTYRAFSVAEEHRNPVIILSDASIGQMMEPVVLPEYIEHDINQFEWTLKGTGGAEPKTMSSNSYKDSAYDTYILEKYNRISEQEQQWEEYQTEDAETVLVAYGITARVCREVVDVARSQGIRLGLIRPVTLYPYPVKAFREKDHVKRYISVELSALAQHAEDVALATQMKKPIYAITGGQHMFYTEDVLEKVIKIIEGKEKELFV